MSISGYNINITPELITCYPENNIFEGRRRICGFDLDDTLIKTKSGRKFRKDSADWTWNGEVIEKIQYYYNKKNGIIAVFSNQAGIGEKHSDKLDSLITTISMLIEEFNKINVYCYFHFAPSKDWKYRKPLPGMWEYICNYIPHKINMKKSFFVGDAYGTTTGNKSFCDKQFADNIGIKFFTPDEIFNDAVEKELSDTVIFDPYEQSTDEDNSFLEIEKSIKYSLDKNNKIVFIFTGPPGSGKTSYINKFGDYNTIVINQDTLKTKNRCLKEFKLQLSSDIDIIIIDRTNPSKENRKEWINIINKDNVDIYSIDFTDPSDKKYERCRYQAKARYVESKGETKMISTIVYNIYKKNYTTPSKDEGFTQLFSVIPSFIMRPIYTKYRWLGEE